MATSETQIGDVLRSPAGDWWRVVAKDSGIVTLNLVGGTGHDLRVTQYEIGRAAGWN